ncbi:MAG: disulfide bond formation protein B [Planctomycetes bacterium]|nr:disulfide bond formation protein B [Planctomycetota bacterium]
MANITPPAPDKTLPDLKILWTRAALFVAVVGVLGSLHLSLSMDLKACPLCLYQRAFMMSVAAILAFGMFLPSLPTAALSVLALAPAVAGAGIAAHHAYLDATGVLECPAGVTGVLMAPQESLIVFLFLVVFLAGDLFHQKRFVMQGLGAILLGYVFYTTCMKGTPKMPPRTVPYPAEQELDGCRMKYKAPA